jgi:hypothetical protein
MSYKTDHLHYSNYYNEETKEVIAKAFAWDIDHFGYEFEDKT